MAPQTTSRGHTVVACGAAQILPIRRLSAAVPMEAYSPLLAMNFTRSTQRLL